MIPLEPFKLLPIWARLAKKFNVTEQIKMFVCKRYQALLGWPCSLKHLIRPQSHAGWSRKLSVRLLSSL